MSETDENALPEGKLPQEVEETVSPIPQRKPRSPSTATKRKDLENEDFEGDIRSKAEKRGQAHKFRHYLFWICAIITGFWTLAIFATIIITGIGLITLSDNVLIALVSSSLPNVFGIFLVVVRYAFRHD